MSINNPLRYKSKLVPYIRNLIETECLTNCTLYEPYAGSAAVSLALLESQTISKAVINELDPLIYFFWVSVMHDTNSLIKLIENTDITLDNWKYFSQYRDSSYITNKSPLEIGFAGLYLNRTNFSGILNANPLGGMDQKSQYKINCRFNKKRIIKSIQELSCFSDKIETKSYPWLISYDDHPEIKRIYRHSKKQHIYLDYSANTHVPGKELLLSNLEIPPMEINAMPDANCIG